MSDPPILAHLHGVRPAGKGWLAYCPAHDDEAGGNPSLSVGVGAGGKLLLKCHAHACAFEAITKASGVADTPMPSPNGRHPPTIVATYDYRDERGALLYQVVRLEPKDFRQRRPAATGWSWSLAGVRRVVYRLDELIEQRRVFVVEGEKDADRLWSVGIPATTTAGGAASWEDEYPVQILAGGATEIIGVPDNDPPGRAYMRKMLAALVRPGVTVQLLELPGLPPKGDVSDWLDGGHTAAELVALAADAPLFVPGETASAMPAVAEPEVRRDGADLTITWPGGVRFLLTSVHDSSREGVRGELTVLLHDRRLSWGALSLSSTSAREGLRKKLEGLAAELPWGDYLEDVAYRLTQAWREGEPIVELSGAVTSPTREVLPRLLYEGEPTLLYGDGDTGKSLVALTLCVALQTGVSLPHGLLPSRTMATAYLDWETSRDTLEGRLALLAAGLGVAAPAIAYKRMTRPLVDEAVALAADFSRRRVGLVVIDSMMFAVAGGDGAAFHEPITAFYGALRLFAPAAVLITSHVTGSDARAKEGVSRPFGGAFAWNGPRLIWEAKRDQDVSDATAIAFTCRKANNLPGKPEPFGLRFTPGHGEIAIGVHDLAEAPPATVSGASMPFRARLLLASADLTTSEIAEALGISPNAARVVLGRLKAKGQAVEREGAPGKPTRWGIAP